jgi:hypothetical protein
MTRWLLLLWMFSTIAWGEDLKGSSFEKSSHIKLNASIRKPAHIGAFQGFEVNYESNHLSGRLRLVLGGHRSYSVLAFVAKSDRKSLEQFMKSARLK